MSSTLASLSLIATPTLTCCIRSKGYRRGNPLPHPMAPACYPLRRSNQAQGELNVPPSLPSIPSSSHFPSFPLLLEHHHHHWIQGSVILLQLVFSRVLRC